MYRGEEVAPGRGCGARWDCSGYRVMSGHPTDMVGFSAIATSRKMRAEVAWKFSGSSAGEASEADGVPPKPLLKNVLGI